MKVYEKKEVTELKEIYLHTICDKCGEPIVGKETDNWFVINKEYNRKEASITCVEYTMEICDECLDKLIFFLKNEGYDLRSNYYDF